MIKFIYGYLLGVGLCLLLVALAFIFSSGVGEYSDDASWTSKIISERLQLAKGITDDKIIIVSGSGGLFGISAEIVERRLSRPTINAASHAALSWDYLDYYASSIIKQGDTIILPLELEYFTKKPGLNALTVKTAHVNGLGFFLYAPLPLKWEYFTMMPSEYLLRAFESARDISNFKGKGGYFVFESTKHGDIDTSKGRPSPDQVISTAAKWNPSRKINEKSANAICSTIRRWVGQGVKVYATSPNRYLALPFHTSYMELQRKIASKYESCGAVFVYSDRFGLQALDRMLDTVYHLNFYGRNERTYELAGALCTLMGCTDQLQPVGPIENPSQFSTR